MSQGTMMETDPLPESFESGDYPVTIEDNYRALSGLAVVSVVLALMALSGFLIAVLSSLGVLAAILGFVALRSIKRYPDELSGQGVAKAGIFLGLLAFTSAAGMHSYVYLTEVPDGYQRLHYFVLQPQAGQPDQPPKDALALDGQRVFLKGYIHPDAGLGKLKKFVLVPDMGTCCFGGQPDFTDMVEVELVGNQSLRYSRRQQRLGGVLHVTPKLQPIEKLQGVYYRLEADVVK